MELPPATQSRKASSTTLRNATGERALPARGAATIRWRAPAIVAGVALVAAITLLVVLRGGGAGERRDEADQNAAAPAPATSRPVVVAPEENRVAPAAAPRAPAPRLAPAAEPAPPAPPSVAPNPAIVDEKTSPARKGSGKAKGKGAGTKPARSARAATAPVPETEPARATTDGQQNQNKVQESSNKSPIIPN
jgi:hypothetical protein